ncbi:MAG: methyltransferase domain-containing protein [Hyphomonadaceae bacterium]
MTGGSSPHKSLAGKGVYPASKAGWLLNPLRRLIMSPRRMVGRLGLTVGEQVLEIGPGPGWFSPEIASAITPGRLVLFDIQAEMLALAAARLEQAGHRNFACIEGDAIALPFEDGQFDAVLVVTVLGEISDPARALREIARVLRPRGRVVIAEQLGDPDHVPRSMLLTLAKEAGLDAVRIEGSLLLYSAVLRHAPGKKKEAPLP